MANGPKFSLTQDWVGGMVKDGSRAKRDYPEPSLAGSADTARVVSLMGETMCSFTGCRWLGALQKRDIMAFRDRVVESFGALCTKRPLLRVLLLHHVSTKAAYLLV